MTALNIVCLPNRPGSHDASALNSGGLSPTLAKVISLKSQASNGAPGRQDRNPVSFQEEISTGEKKNMPNNETTGLPAAFFPPLSVNLGTEESFTRGGRVPARILDPSLLLIIGHPSVRLPEMDALQEVKKKKKRKAEVCPSPPQASEEGWPFRAPIGCCSHWGHT